MVDSILPDSQDRNSVSATDYEPFMTMSDEGNIPAGHEGVPGMVIHPEATARQLWAIAQSRLDEVEKLLSIIASGGPDAMLFSPSDLAGVIRPRVQEIQMLAAAGNDRAACDRGAAT